MLILKIINQSYAALIYYDKVQDYVPTLLYIISKPFHYHKNSRYALAFFTSRINMYAIASTLLVKWFIFQSLNIYEIIKTEKSMF